ncbi:hypothetical protein LTR08_007100 [Meristemomyces frigidus]|nr:hypothetical protein LTR08_007100 [Meristemomyces frigidus]
MPEAVREAVEDELGEAPPAEPLLEVAAALPVDATFEEMWLPVPVVVETPLEPAVRMMPLAPATPVVEAPDESATRAVDVPDAVPVAEADDDVEAFDEQELEVSADHQHATRLVQYGVYSRIVTPAPLHTLAKSLMAVAVLLPQFLQMYCSTSVALLPLQTACRADGSG